MFVMHSSGLRHPSVMSLWGISVVVLAVSVSVCGGEGERGCPDDLMSSASSCLPGDFTEGLISNFTVIQRYCREGRFQQSVQCLSDLKDSCQDDPEDQLLLDRLLDLQAWKTGWSDLCHDLKRLEQHSPCWTMTLQMSAECVKTRMTEFRLQVTSLDDVTPSSASPSSLLLIPPPSRPGAADGEVTETLEDLRMYCNLSQHILHCFLPKLHELCPLDTARLLENTYLAFQPPLCHERTRVLSENDEEDDDDNTDEKSMTSPGPKPAPCHHGIIVTLFAGMTSGMAIFR